MLWSCRSCRSCRSHGGCVVVFVSCSYCRFVKVSRMFVIAVRTAFSCLCLFSSSLFCSQLKMLLTFVVVGGGGVPMSVGFHSMSLGSVTV